MSEPDDRREKYDLREQARINWDNSNLAEPEARFGPMSAILALLAFFVILAAFALFT